MGLLTLGDLVWMVKENLPPGYAVSLKGVITRTEANPRTGRNKPCHCESGKKFKKCHGAKS
jgi:hypothetical protein